MLDHSDFYGTTTLSIDKMPDAPFYLDQEHKTLFVIAGSRNVYCENYQKTVEHFSCGDIS